MRWAVVSDIHANLEALDAVLADLERQRPGAIVCLGDFVGYGASPNECIERLRPLLAAAVIGNHDLAACRGDGLEWFTGDAARAARWTDTVLTPAHRDWLLGLPYTAVYRGTRLVHASPAHPEEWSYVLSAGDAEAELAAFAEPVGFIGHSHFPGAFERDATGGVRYTREPLVTMASGCRYLVNVPSVGQPRDADPRAGYLMVDEEARTLAHVRLGYDVGAARRRIEAAGLPRFLGARLERGE